MYQGLSWELPSLTVSPLWGRVYSQCKVIIRGQFQLCRQTQAIPLASRSLHLPLRTGPGTRWAGACKHSHPQEAQPRSDLRSYGRTLLAFENGLSGVPAVVQQKRIRLGTMRLWVPSLASLSGLKIWRCHELWYRSQRQLRSGIAVAVA